MEGWYALLIESRDRAADIRRTFGPGPRLRFFRTNPSAGPKTGSNTPKNYTIEGGSDRIWPATLLADTQHGRTCMATARDHRG